MQEYLQKTRLSSVLDEIGSQLLLLAGCLLVFFLLWGFRPMAVLAGLASFVLVCLLRAKSRARRLQQRELRLRRRIGGELRLEAWTVCPPERAHLEAAQLIAPVFSLRPGSVLKAGVLCRQDGRPGKILAACAQLHRSERLTARDIAAFQRACAGCGAECGILCGAAGAGPEAEEQADLSPRVMLVDRERMIALAGAVYPADDQQLVMLGQRRRRGHTLRTLRRTVLDARRAQKYGLYGLLLISLYILTGLMYYCVPGLVCLLLMCLCRLGKSPRGSFLSGGN